MKLFKNNEVKKLTLILISFLIIITILIFITSNIIIKSYKNYFLDYNAHVLSFITTKYPDLEDDVINQILTSDPKKGSDILGKYGINEKTINTLIEPINKEYNHILLSITVICLIIYIPFVMIILIFLNYLYKKIRKLNDYTLNIAYKDYQIDIRDNDEGDVSILKNHLYDITRILKENNELLETDKLYLKNAIADISHQLKTPLTSLYIFNEILIDEKENTNRIYFLDKMRKELERIEWLITSLLNMSKLDSKTIALKKEEINVASIVKSATDSLKPVIDEKQIKISVKGNDDISFMGDFYWMREALINIIKNGVEHTKKLGHIEISFDTNPLYTKIDIKDDGEGISPNDIPHIFERFYKAKGSGKNSVGIGLALAKSIINNQNGDISVKSEVNKYTKFTIKIYNK
jgi:signal transduction histidine kinase